VPSSEIHDRRQRDDRRGHAGQSDSGRRPLSAARASHLR